MFWNLVLVTLNLFWIIRLLLDRRPVKLSDDEKQLCQITFRTFTPREMKKFLNFQVGKMQPQVNALSPRINHLKD